MTTYWLSTHLPYACRHSGACCTARWPIPIEHERAGAVASAIAAGRLDAPLPWYRTAPGAPGDVAGVLALQPSGACVFHRPAAAVGGASTGGCAIHPLRPASCVHFPYVCVVDPRGVHVTLSHFCPTAAALLFDDEAPVAVVAGPPVFADGRMPEGLDAREALPPVEGADEAGSGVGTASAAPGAARPRLMSWDDVTAWLDAYLRELAQDARVPAPPSRDVFDSARHAVPAAWGWPEAPLALDRAWHELVAPGWGRWRAVVARYLAARAHASWAMYLGEGPRDVRSLTELARTVLQVEAVRRCVDGGGPLDRASLLAAIRQSDLLLVHHADPQRLIGAAR